MKHLIFISIFFISDMTLAGALVRAPVVRELLDHEYIPISVISAPDFGVAQEMCGEYAEEYRWYDSNIKWNLQVKEISVGHYSCAFRSPVGDILTIKATEEASTESAERVTANQCFQIGEVTEAFTTTAIHHRARGDRHSSSVESNFWSEVSGSLKCKITERVFWIR